MWSKVGASVSLYRIFKYLQVNMSINSGRIAFEPFYQPTDPNLLSNTARNIEMWKDFYPDAYDTLPEGQMDPLDKPVRIRVYSDVNHAGNLVSRRSHSGHSVYCWLMDLQKCFEKISQWVSIQVYFHLL